jgi:uncharacterized protein (TIGR00255 family)
MTGFARISRSTPFGDLTLSIKTVNHRGLDVHIHMPMEFDGAEPALRTALRKRVARGHVQVQVFLKRSAGPAVANVINEPLLRSWLEAFQDAAGRFGIDCKPDLNQALRMPGMLESGFGAVPAETEGLEAEVLAAAALAIDELDEFRVREGDAIEKEILMRTNGLRELASRMEDIRSRALPAFQKRLQDRLSEMLGGSNINAQIDPTRIAQEAAMLAERSDIAEELVRLKTHADQTEALLAAEGETGKKLDFLLQEMNRETNTILSKTSGLGETGLTLTNFGLAAKAEIDRIREQSLNIE